MDFLPPFDPPPGELSAVLLAALVSAVATLALMAFLGPRLALRRAGPAASGAAACDFLVNGASLRALTEPARALLATLPVDGPRLAALAAHHAADCPSLRADLEALVLYGAGFRHHCPRGDGTAYEIVGEPRGAAALVSIRPATDEARALADAEAELARAGDELGFLREVLDRAPVMAWSCGADGQVAWANAPYRDRFDAPAGELPDHRIANAFAQVVEEVPLTPRGPGSRRRVAVAGRDDTEPRWCELTETPGPAGGTFGFALDADDLVAAEASLRRFVETLTETFAHLPIGLAVFDKNRRLGLFNPALTDLVKIDAVWLAGRPSLRDFLERLRETRQMPEQKDFASFRRKLGELEEGAREGTYEENWQLPSGKIFRVTGRPHPQGALAFLFEDISSSIILERRYRSELELSQATLDRMSEAVAVFDASGMLVFVNSAFESLWGLDPMESLSGPGVAELCALWSGRCAATDAWARLAEFATAEAEARASWTAGIEIAGGPRLELLVAPLPDTSALVVFRPPAPEACPDGALAALALEQLRLPAEAAVQQLAAAIPAAASSAAFQALSGAAQGLRDGLARARELETAATGEADAPLAGLAAALARRGLRLELPAAAADWSPEERRLATALAFAAADAAAPGAAITLAGDGLRLTASVPAAPSPHGGGIGLALARRLIDEAGGSFAAASEAGTASFAATLPALPAPSLRLA
ncbi:MAG TPA: PAS-domain containing protein [Amaricoccus sp.]|nr:PAS-domain containing protein [Amaricoccus sp.]